MNTAKAPLDDLRVRQAILHTVDRDVINELLYDGRYLPSYGPMIPGSTCYWSGAETMYPVDLEKANALLDEAGWVMNDSTGIREKDGEALEVRWTALHHGEIGEVLKAQLQEVGINIIVEVVAGPVQIDMATNRDFHLMYERQRGTDPVFMDIVWNSKNSGEGGWAWTGFKDETLDELLDKSNVEADLDTRCEYLVDAQKIIMENALTLGLFGQPRFWVVNENVDGFELGPSAWMYYPYNLRVTE
jgi:ABC-type transport system substrate-binding protein